MRGGQSSTYKDERHCGDEIDRRSDVNTGLLIREQDEIVSSASQFEAYIYICPSSR